MGGIDLRRWRLAAGATAAVGLLVASIALVAFGRPAIDIAPIGADWSARTRDVVEPASPVSQATPTSTSVPPSISSDLPIGKRAVTATFRDVSPMAAPLRAGDAADVVAVFRKDQVKEQTGESIDEDTVALIRGLTVIEVGSVEPSVAPTADRPSDAFHRRSFTVTASLEEAQLIALARQVGELRIGRCSTARCDDRNLTAP